nr:LysR family transcriptional regulator [Mangrovicoccus sp. HB161399]
MRYFAETARAGSMRQAAERLSVAASAVNRQIIKLEDQLQAKLFERRAEGVRLTAAGEVLYGYAMKLDQDLERAIGHIDDLRGLRRGHVRLACEDGLGRDFLPPVLAAYHAAYPGVTFSVEIAGAKDIMEMVAAEAVDIGIAMSPPVRGDLTIAAISEIPLGVICPPGSHLARRGALKLTDLIGEPLVNTRKGTGGGTGWRDYLEASDPRTRAFDTNAPDFVTNLVRAGLGVGVRTPVGVMAEIAAGTLAFVPIEDRLAPPPSLTVYVQPMRTLPGAGAMLLERLKEALPGFRAEVGQLVRSRAAVPDAVPAETGVAAAATLP